MDLAKSIADNREQILRAADKYGARNIRVFGSVARGDCDETSDVDFLVSMDDAELRGIHYFGALQGLCEDLEKILGCRVDVVDEKGLRERIRDEVLAEARAI